MADSKQLLEARQDHDRAQKASQQHAESLREKGEAFLREQTEIDRRLLVVTQSETSDEALQQFEKIMEQLRRLDVASGYVEMLQEVDTLR